MNITLYNNTSDRQTVSKSLTQLYTFNDAVARDAFNVRKGSITIASSSDLSKVNYAYISDLARYYYVDDIVALRNGVWVLNLTCDPLMTFESGIRALTGTVDRQENVYNGYIQDGQYRALAYTKIVTKTFPNAMTSDNLILMTVG